MEPEACGSRRQTPALVSRLHRVRDHILQFVTYAGVGAVATLVHYTLLVLLVQGAGLDAVLSSAAGALAGAVTAYLLNHRYTFASRQPHTETAGRFFAVAFAGLLLNVALMVIAVRGLGLHYLVAQVVATGLVLLWTYGANRCWTFR